MDKDKKILVLDLDGTLTNSKKEITDVTKNAVWDAIRHGHTVVLASGRPTPGVLSVAGQLELEKLGGYMVSYNGGQITDCKTGEILYQQTLPYDVVPELFEMAEKLDIGLITYDKKGIIAADRQPDKYIDLESRINNLPVLYMKDIVSYIDFPINKCLGTADTKIAPQVEKMFFEKFGSRVNVMRSEPFFIEITPKGVDKAAALQCLCDKLGTTKDNVIACGDGFNDISMIEFAGMGIAMANAQQQVKDAADYITVSNDEDGVAKVIYDFVI